MKNLLVLAMLMANVVLSAQITVSGTIKDAQTKETLPGVNVYLPEIKKGVVTNSDGKYELNLPKQGSYKLQVSFVGYAIVLKTIAADKSLSLDFELKEAIIEAKEFVVSSVYHSSQDENPVEVIQFNHNQLQQSAEISLLHALGNVAGVSVSETGTGISKPVIRGLSNNRVLTFIQGMPFDNQQWGDDHGLGLNELGIDKVEIIKGPSSLLYGADAMGGVLHFVAEKPAPVNTISTYVEGSYFSNTDGYKGSFGFKGAKEKFRYSLNGGYNTHSDYKQAGSIANKPYYRVTNTRFNERAIRGSFGILTKNWTSDVTYSYIQSAIGIFEGQSFQNFDKKLFMPFQLTTSNVLSMENTFFIGKSKVSLNLGYQNNDRKEFEDEHAHEDEDEEEHEEHEEHEDEEETAYFNQKLFYSLNDTGAFDMNLTTYNYDVKWFLPTDKQLKLILGSQGKIQTNSNRGHEVLIPDADVSQYGVFALAKYNHNRFNFLAGLRYDVKSFTSYETEAEEHEEHEEDEEEHEDIDPINKSFGALNGSFGVTYQLDSAWLLRTNVATGFRTPSLAELTSNGVHHGALRYELGNSELTTENNVEIDLGIEFNSKHVSWSLAGFYNQIANYIYIAPQDSLVDNVQLFEYTQTDASLYGFETTLDIHPHSMHWLHFETQFAMVIGKKANGDYLPRIPSNNLLNTLKAELNDFKFIQKPFVSVALNTVFNQSNVDAFETETDSYALINVNLGGTIKVKKQKIELSLGVTNLLDQEYYNHLSRLKSSGIANMGRNVMVKLRIPFDFKQG